MSPQLTGLSRDVLLLIFGKLLKDASALGNLTYLISLYDNVHLSVKVYHNSYVNFLP